MDTSHPLSAVTLIALYMPTEHCSVFCSGQCNSEISILYYLQILQILPPSNAPYSPLDLAPCPKLANNDWLVDMINTKDIITWLSTWIIHAGVSQRAQNMNYLSHIPVISDATQHLGRDKKNNNDNLDFLPFNLDVASAPVNGDCILFMFCGWYNVD